MILVTIAVLMADTTTPLTSTDTVTAVGEHTQLILVQVCVINLLLLITVDPLLSTDCITVGDLVTELYYS